MTHRVLYVPPHDCYAEKLTFNLDKDRWECPVCGVPYQSPQHPQYVFPPEERLAFFNPFWMKVPALSGSKGHCNGDGTLLLEPGNKVLLSDIKADVLVTWEPWRDYSKR